MQSGECMFDMWKQLKTFLKSLVLQAPSHLSCALMYPLMGSFQMAEINDAI